MLVTDRDRVVAELIPPQPGRSPFLTNPQLAQLVREGLVTPAKRAGGPLPRKPVMSVEELMRDLSRDREDR